MAIIFGFPGYEKITKTIASQINAVEGLLTVRHFPDGESYVKIETEIKNQEVVVVCGLDNPDAKAMALMFFAATAKELGANKIGLIAPYLGYMRQDIRFHDGEAITSNIFAKFLSNYFDWLITVDPHLHRHKSLDEIYSLNGIVVHATHIIAEWIKNNVANPVLIGPDEESEQWVSDIAHKANTPFTVLKKIRHGDTNVEISVPEVEKYKNHTPVLVDDIISTARTMIETINHLNNAGMKPPVCIGIHAVFAHGAYENLLNTGVKQVITCNTITHISNGIDISHVISGAIRSSYHPKDVSLEVEAMLHLEDRSAESGWDAVQDTILGNSHYSQSSYALGKELGFNPVTNQKATDKYVKHQHEQAFLYNHIEQLKNQEKMIEAKKLLAEGSFFKLKKSFMAAIQAMLRNYNILAKKNLKNQKDVHLTFLNTREVNKIIKEHSVTVKAKYDIHPHVDALLKERKQAHDHELHK